MPEKELLSALKHLRSPKEETTQFFNTVNLNEVDLTVEGMKKWGKSQGLWKKTPFINPDSKAKEIFKKLLEKRVFPKLEDRYGVKFRVGFYREKPCEENQKFGGLTIVPQVREPLHEQPYCILMVKRGDKKTATEPFPFSRDERPFPEICRVTFHELKHGLDFSRLVFHAPNLASQIVECSEKKFISEISKSSPKVPKLPWKKINKELEERADEFSRRICIKDQKIEGSFPLNFKNFVDQIGAEPWTAAQRVVSFLGQKQIGAAALKFWWRGKKLLVMDYRVNSVFKDGSRDLPKYTSRRLIHRHIATRAWESAEDWLGKERWNLLKTGCTYKFYKIAQLNLDGYFFYFPESPTQPEAILLLVDQERDKYFSFIGR